MHPEVDIRKFKLVISDLDGTILDSGQPLHPFTKEVIAKLAGYGILFTLASGRSLASLRPFADELKVEIPLVLANGCIIQSLNGMIHHRSLMPVGITRKVFEITDREKSDLVVFVDDRLYYKKMTNNILSVFGKVKDAIYEVGSWDAMEDIIIQVNKFMIIEWESLERLDHLEKVFEHELEGKADYLRTNLHHLEVMPKGISKATGLKNLADDLEIQMEEILAFGDFDNDAEMLAAVGLGAAVANASEKAKAKAGLIIGSCADNGPAVFLNQLLQNE
ncbi:MAG TPA: HAD family hydrolase [Pelolinea sp.]|nr:HAD family hydrolase [Pelolinea sp.]